MDNEEMQKRLDWYEKRFGPYIGEKGLKSGLKNLWRKPNRYEWIILIMLLLSLFASWAYYHDTEACREYISTQQQQFEEFYNNSVDNSSSQNDLLEWKSNSYFIPLCV